VAFCSILNRDQTRQILKAYDKACTFKHVGLFWSQN
jgi:hypothetical protein